MGTHEMVDATNRANARVASYTVPTESEVDFYVVRSGYEIDVHADAVTGTQTILNSCSDRHSNQALKQFIF